MEKFASTRIAPDIVNTAPTSVVQVIYPSGVKINLGNEVTPLQVKDQPAVSWQADKNSLYTLIMTDPTATILKEPWKTQLLHWFVGNVPGDDLEKADVVKRYGGSAPRPRGAMHTYVFLVFKQKGTIDFGEEKSEFASYTPNSPRPGGPPVFSVKKVVEKYDLGDPVAGNFFTAQMDDYTEENIKRFMNRQKSN